MVEPLDLAALRQEIVERGLQGLALEEQVSHLVTRLATLSLPIKRAALGVRTLHPQYGALTYLWRPGMDSVEATPQDRAVLAGEAFVNSPIHYLVTSGRDHCRFRLDGDDEVPFPVLDEVRDQGMTDYVAYLVRFQSSSLNRSTLEGMFFSCATDAVSGFDAAHLAAITALLPHLAIAMKSRLTYDVAKTVAETYLGADAGQRVLTGEIVRGSTQSIDAIIWFCDLRGFSQLANKLDREALIATLNAYLAAMAEPVDGRGGQILKILGDGFLATFDLVERESGQVVTAALDAAVALRSGIARLNDARTADGRPTLEFGLALHVGTVFYGNIGTETRLDFTVVGPAVNEASRIQDLCRPLDRDLLLSAAFEGLVDPSRHALQSLGHHQLRGVSTPMELFTLPTA